MLEAGSNFADGQDPIPGPPSLSIPTFRMPPESLPDLLQEPESSLSFLSGNPLGEEGADSRTMLFTSFQMGY